jgi:hypothetical protein
MFNPLSGNHPYVPYFVILPCLMPEDFICQEVDQSVDTQWFNNILIITIPLVSLVNPLSGNAP